MAIERHHTVARLAEIRTLLGDARRAKAEMADTDFVRAHQLASQLDEMLKELRGPVQDVQKPKASGMSHTDAGNQVTPVSDLEMALSSLLELIAPQE